MHSPVPYKSDTYLHNDPELYLETPYCESFYPGASVGYSRVIVKNLDHSGEGVTKAADGISVTEFYTAKNFPVSVDYTGLITKKTRLPYIVPFLGNMSF